MPSDSAAIPPFDTDPSERNLIQRGHALTEREPWLISFLDLLMVMVTLLVLLLSYEALQTQEKKSPDSQIEDAVATESLPSAPADARHEPEPLAQQASVFDSVADERAFLDRLYIGDLQGRVDVSVAGKQVKLGISDNILFTAGDAALSLSGQRVLDELAQMLRHRPWLITVEGHTDNQPIATPRYPSNWELSAARASQVTRYLIAMGLQDERLRAVGYADTRPRAANDAAEGRARNRRVELVLSVPDKAG